MATRRWRNSANPLRVRRTSRRLQIAKRVLRRLTVRFPERQKGGLLLFTSWTRTSRTTAATIPESKLSNLPRRRVRRVANVLWNNPWCARIAWLSRVRTTPLSFSYPQGSSTPRQGDLQTLSSQIGATFSFSNLRPRADPYSTGWNAQCSLSKST